jgi:hypothetical protein
MITSNKRIGNHEANVVQLYNQIKELATDDELDAVITQLFSKQEDLRDRITILEDNLTLVQDVLNTAQG